MNGKGCKVSYTLNVSIHVRDCRKGREGEMEERRVTRKDEIQTDARVTGKRRKKAMEARNTNEEKNKGRE